MPSSSDELREWARAEFGSIDAGPVVAWLESQGYKSLWDKKNYGCWEGPPRPETEKEALALDFLCLEWDFGGVVR